MTVAEKYGLTPVMVEALTDPAGALAKLHALALDLKGKVEAIDKASAASDGTKGPNALETKYAKDEDGRKAAESFLRADGGPFDQIVAYIGEDAGRTLHVKNAVSDLLGKYLATEIAFFVNELTPKAAKVSRKGEYKADFNELRELIVHVVGMATQFGFDPSKSDLLEEYATDKYRSILPGFRGTKSQDDGTVTGRYAKVYALAWSIDGEDVEDGWTIPDIVRMIWTGADRIGKNAKNLTDILDAKTTWTKPEFKTASFTVNGHKVAVSRTETD